MRSDERNHEYYSGQGFVDYLDLWFLYGLPGTLFPGYHSGPGGEGVNSAVQDAPGEKLRRSNAAGYARTVIGPGADIAIGINELHRPS
jgi:hypothetical protein